MDKMDKINLDISKYSCEELLDIFNIKEIGSSEQLHGNINNYKNNIFLEQNLSLKRERLCYSIFK